MPNLYTITAGRENTDRGLDNGEIFSVIYHDVFDYPLTFSELIKWRAPDASLSKDVVVATKNGYSYLQEKEGLVYKRLLRKRISAKKMEIATNAAHILSFIPLIKMVAVTGSLAMENSDDGSDIDLMIVTKKRNLWTARILAYVALYMFGLGIRKSESKNQSDQLCLNMWLDESDLKWSENDRNFYTAHEIAQMIPLTDRDRTYEKFLSINKWILNFWPNSVKVREGKNIKTSKNKSGFIEKVAFALQYAYMRSKITREIVSPTRAIFHPNDWGVYILSRLGLDTEA